MAVKSVVSNGVTVIDELNSYTGSLSSADAAFISLYQKTDSKIVARFKLIEAWWLSSQSDFPDLVTFLVKHEILESSAAKTLEMVHKGYVKLPNIEGLLSRGGLEKIDRHHQKLAETRMVANQPAPQNNPNVAQAKSGAIRPSPSNDVTRSAPSLDQKAPAELQTQTRTLPKIGDSIGKCLVIEHLGRGSSSEVFRAVHKSLEMTVAVKLLLPELDSGPDQAIDFAKEARALAKFSHQNIIRIHDFDKWNGIPYLVLELIDGVTLEELIGQVGVLQPNRALEIVSAAAKGLQHAFEHGFCHRDVKPANILISRTGEIKMADLGLAQVVKTQKRPTTASNEKHNICGTPAYIAPEQINGEHEVDERSDIYSLGATLYSAITGQAPFSADSTLDLLLAHLNKPAPDPRDLRPNLPSAICHLVMTMLEKDPNCRFQNYRQLLEAMDYVEKIMTKPADIETGKFLRDKSQIFRDSEKLIDLKVKDTSSQIQPTMSGQLSQMGIEQIVQFLNWTHKTGELSIKCAGVSAGISFRDGEIYHCWYGQKMGPLAFSAISSNRNGRFEFFDNKTHTQISVECSTMSLLMNVARDQDETVFDA